MVRFDAYTATMRGPTVPDLLDLIGVSDDDTIDERPGFHGFGMRLSVRDDTRTEWAAIQYGGQHDRIMVEVKGDKTPAVVEAIRSVIPDHRCTRMDSCADWDEPGAFDRLYQQCKAVKQAHRIKGEMRGDWEDHPDDGRTYYLGAPTSTARVRLYEKGRQPEYRHLHRPHWTRLEVQVRPTGEARETYAKVAPSDAWGASRWTRELAQRVLRDHIDPHPAGTIYRRPHRDAAIDWMCRQYGVHLVSLAEDLGSWECLGYTLRDIINSHRRTKP